MSQILCFQEKITFPTFPHSKTSFLLAWLTNWHSTVYFKSTNRDQHGSFSNQNQTSLLVLTLQVQIWSLQEENLYCAIDQVKLSAYNCLNKCILRLQASLTLCLYHYPWSLLSSPFIPAQITILLLNVFQNDNRLPLVEMNHFIDLFIYIRVRRFFFFTKPKCNMYHLPKPMRKELYIVLRIKSFKVIV